MAIDVEGCPRDERGFGRESKRLRRRGSLKGESSRKAEKEEFGGPSANYQFIEFSVKLIKCAEEVNMKSRLKLGQIYFCPASVFFTLTLIWAKTGWFERNREPV
jgi:hypothetical protein